MCISHAHGGAHLSKKTERWAIFMTKLIKTSD